MVIPIDYFADITIADIAAVMLRRNWTSQTKPTIRCNNSACIGIPCIVAGQEVNIIIASYILSHIIIEIITIHLHVDAQT